MQAGKGCKTNAVTFLIDETEEQEEAHNRTVLWVAQLSGPKCKSLSIQIDP